MNLTFIINKENEFQKKGKNPTYIYIPLQALGYFKFPNALVHAKKTSRG